MGIGIPALTAKSRVPTSSGVIKLPTSGVVEFLTIYPGWYTGRTPHIHGIIRLYSGTTVTFEFITQFFFPDELTTKVYQFEPYAARASGQTTDNKTDRVFNYEDCTTGATGGDELGWTIVRATSSYMIAEYTLEIDLTAPPPKLPLANVRQWID